MSDPAALVIGAGPAGLMAAETMAAAGLSVVVADAMPSPARKFLMAGKSGLNLTKDESADAIIAACGADWLAPILRGFDATAMQDWARGLGQGVFTGTSGRVFPVAMKGSPLLRAVALPQDHILDRGAVKALHMLRPPHVKAHIHGAKRCCRHVQRLHPSAVRPQPRP